MKQRRDVLFGYAAPQFGKALPFRLSFFEIGRLRLRREARPREKKEAELSVRQSLTALCGGEAAKR